MVNVTDYLVAHGLIVQQSGAVELTQAIEKDSTPITLSQLIERQFEPLPLEDQRLLEVASVRGMSFCSAAVAAGLGKPVEEVEQRCAKLVEREQFLQPGGTGRWPDGTVFSRYSFIHALYQNVIYEQVTEARRARLHQTIGERLEAGYRGQTEEIAAELASHFERAGDYGRAVRYLLLATQRAVGLCAYDEAIIHAKAGLELLKSLPDRLQQAETELNFQLFLSVSLSSTRGYAASEVADAYNRANMLCQGVGEQSLRLQALNGLWSFHLIRGAPDNALSFGKQMLKTARSLEHQAFRADAHTNTGIALFYLGEFTSAQEHFEKAISLYDLDSTERPGLNKPDTVVFLLTYTALNLWLLGYPARDLQMRHKALHFAQQLSHPLSLVIAQIMLAGYHQCRTEAQETLKLSENGIKCAREYGFFHWLAAGIMCKGWALASTARSREGVSLLHEGLKNWKLTGAKTELARFTAMLAHAYLMAGQAKKGLHSVSDALAVTEETGDRFYEAELYRLKGELLLKNKIGKEAETCFLKAIEVARDQRAKSWELRATTSLCRLWQRQGGKKEARQMLKRIYGWFTEGLDSPNLREARLLLEELS